MSKHIKALQIISSAFGVDAGFKGFWRRDWVLRTSFMSSCTERPTTIGGVYDDGSSETCAFKLFSIWIARWFFSFTISFVIGFLNGSSFERISERIYKKIVK